MEDKVGSIEVGKYADFVVLEKNLFEVPAHEISKTEINATYYEGVSTYKRD